MANTTGNYFKNGNESVLGLQCLETLRLQLGNFDGKQRKLLAQRQRCPENTSLFFPFSHQHQLEAMEKGTAAH